MENTSTKNIRKRWETIASVSSMVLIALIVVGFASQRGEDTTLDNVRNASAGSLQMWLALLGLTAIWTAISWRQFVACSDDNTKRPLLPSEAAFTFVVIIAAALAVVFL